jgi:hypothetical protein
MAAALPPVAELPPPAPEVTVVLLGVPALAPLPDEGVPVVTVPVHPASTAAKQAPTRSPEALLRASIIRFSSCFGTRLVRVLLGMGVLAFGVPAGPNQGSRLQEKLG